MHKPSRATDPLVLDGYKHSAEGAAGDPSQAGFHFLKREWVAIPFSFGRKKILGGRSALPLERRQRTRLATDGGRASAVLLCQ